MTYLIGVRREDKNEWERRVPVVPSQAKALKDLGINCLVQHSDIRIFKDDEYRASGSQITEDLTACNIVFGVKEMPLDFFWEDGTYMFFSHTHKGQDYNMPRLKRMMELRCNLIDYERVVDEHHRRLIFFGWHAGVAGMLESIVALGQRLDHEGVANPFGSLKRPVEYHSMEEIHQALDVLAKEISEKGIPEQVRPLVIGITGYGNVSKGSQEILEKLPHHEITPEQLLNGELGENLDRSIVKVVFKEKDMVRPKEGEFDLQEYYDHPERYDGIFESYLPHITVLMNCVYWDEKYPLVVSNQYLKDNWNGKSLKVIGDISCDIDGGVQATVKPMSPGDPIFVWDIDKEEAIDGIEGNGPVLMTVDILPAELPKEASNHFSNVLKEFLPKLACADYTVPFEELDIPAPIKRAMILCHGKLTPDYQYMEKFI